MKKILFFLLFLPCLVKAQIKDRTKQFDYTIKATTVTVSTGDSSTNIANTAWVKRQGYGSGSGGGTVTSVSGTSNRITSTGGTTPVIDIDAAYVGQTSITTLGTIGTGTWNATTIGLTKGGTGQTTANASFNALAPSQTSNSGKFLTTDGSNTSWATITAITASDTAAITSRAWRTNGNNMAGVTGRFGTTSNDHIDLITNNIVRGRLDAAGELLLGGTTDFGAFTFQNQAASWFSNGSSTAIVGNGDGVNNTLATFTWGIASNAQVNTIWTTPSSANTWEVHDFNSSTPIFTMGSDNNVALTHLITDASTSGKKWGYSARNTFNPTSGDAQRDAFLDSTTVNQTGGANGKYGSFHSILTKTACADCHGVWIENTDSWFGTTSGRVGIGISRATAPTAFLHLAASTTSAASLRLPSGTAPTSPNHRDMWTDANHIYARLNGATYQLDQQSGAGITSINSETGPAVTIAGSDGNTVSASSNTVTISSPYTLIYSDTSQTSVSNTTSITSLLGNIIGSASIDGSTLTAGSVLVLRGYGTISVDATPANCEFDFTISNFTLGLIATGLSSALTNAPFEYEFEVSPFALGTDQFAFYRGKIEILDGSTIKRFTGNSKYSFFTTTGTLTVAVTAQWATANANNTVTSRNNTCEVKRRQ